MENNQNERGVPPDCFRQEELEAFLAAENESLETVHYYTVQAPALTWLYALELQLTGGASLLFATEEDAPAIKLVHQEVLLEAAYSMRSEGLLMERRDAFTSPLWTPALGRTLSGVLLSKNADGLSLNDALVLDFGITRLLVHIGKTEGLSISHHH